MYCRLMCRTQIVFEVAFQCLSNIVFFQSFHFGLRITKVEEDFHENPRQLKNSNSTSWKSCPHSEVPPGKWFINDNKITRKAASNFSWSLIAFGYNNKKQFIMHNRQHTDQYGTKVFYFSVFSPCLYTPDKS